MVRDRVYKIIRGPVLPELTVDFGFNFEAFWPFFADENVRSHGSKGIERFAAEPLGGRFLKVSGRYIVYDGVAEDIVISFLFSDVRAPFADDNR